MRGGREGGVRDGGREEEGGGKVRDGGGWTGREGGRRERKREGGGGRGEATGACLLSCLYDSSCLHQLNLLGICF